MAGLYVHIPFCRSRCLYCGFYSTTSLDSRQRYVEAVCQEIEMRAQKNAIGTIYFGGGTPSQLTIRQIGTILEAIYKYNNVEEDVEVTIECNPDDITFDFAKGLQTLTVNRISMGAQTFSNKRLNFLHRRHTASQVLKAVETLRQTGFQNIGIDLMYGFPAETQDEWEADIEQALALYVPHISTYSLMYEEGTPLYQMFQQGKVTEVDEEQEHMMYERLIDKLKNAGYEHYEISNFAKPGYRSRHNSSYWAGIPYIGIGAAAHSFDIRSRSWNVADIRQYIGGINRGQRLFEEELIDEDTRYNDAITTALRTCEGLNLSTLPERHRHYCLQTAQHLIDDGLLEQESPYNLRLTRKGLFLSDMVMRELIWVD